MFDNIMSKFSDFKGLKRLKIPEKFNTEKGAKIFLIYKFTIVNNNMKDIF